MKEIMQEKKISTKEMAGKLKLSEKEFSDLLTGRLEITLEIAYNLQKATGVPAAFWLNLEKIYRKAKIQKGRSV
ncbi:helix-turn-helix transcriptional regulator [Carboxydothermus ferrireducens]|uniref:Addiction module HigA family antidote n=2 Tax=Carboxydothermus TaxID=129957 RepID=A0ABX2RB76_9THEO|nr:helix-turn-helix domain-containing protein [Carboxydothermus ferrireducens]NYE57117.1 addiction module HigA family antidote [Carboxydothermus ferrireducens DSM 11255]